MKLLFLKSSAVTSLASGLVLVASLGVQAADSRQLTQQMQQGPADLAGAFMECNDGTRFYHNPPHVILHPSLCDNHGGVKAGGGGPRPPTSPRPMAHERSASMDNGDEGRAEAQDYNSTRSNRRKN